MIKSLEIRKLKKVKKEKIETISRKVEEQKT